MKKLLSFLLSLFVVCQTLYVGLLPINATSAKQKTARIIYYRFDQNYETWNLWVWPKDKEGSSYQFTEEAELSSLSGRKVMIAEIDVSDFGTDEAGVIVRKGEWEEKDVEKDRYFKLSGTDSNNVITIYIVQGVEPISYLEADARAYFSPKIQSAEFTDSNTIRVNLQAPAISMGGSEGFKLYRNGHEVSISNVIRGSDGLGYVIKLDERIDLSMSYVLSKEDFGELSVSPAKLFNSDNFNEQFFYNGDDLGAKYSKAETVFKLWAPTAEKVTLELFDQGQGGTPIKSINMQKSDKGIWSAVVDGDNNGTYYTYDVTVNGKTNKASDPYAKAVGVNNERAMVIDLSTTNPDGWDKVSYVNLQNPTDAIIYEMHIRDTSFDSSSGIQNKGKYLGFAEKNTKSPTSGLLTGLSHVKELGVSHIHLLPVFDFNSIDETKLDKPQFNWGYDPSNYNTPEGSYSTDPYNGDIRIREFKEMVKAIKSEGIGVIMDVVYNHTALSANSDFNKIVPGYYYRMVSGEKFSNGSGCGNEIASERLMVRKFIVDSVVYWAKEYKIDGFRFDLMGLHDIETMNAVAAALKAVNPSVIIYGEGWTAGATPLPQKQQGIKANISKAPDIAVFNDSTRDAVKGHVFDEEKPGFVNGDFSLKESIKFGIVGAISHPDINYSKVNYDKIPYAASPSQCVNYISAHDNLTLYDKLVISSPGRTDEDYKAMTKMGGAIILTSQGIPFMLSGTDFMRSKDGDSNSYKSSDSINAIDWELKSTNNDVFEYYKGLASLRKLHPAFRMTAASQVNENLKFIEDIPESIIAYTIDNYANEDEWKTIFLAFNAGNNEETVSLPTHSVWNIVVNGEKAGVETLATINGNTITVPAMSTIVAYDAATVRTIPENNKNEASNKLITLSIVGGLMLLGGIGTMVFKKNKKDK